jgi:hypothetical protein
MQLTVLITAKFIAAMALSALAEISDFTEI